MTLSLTKPGLRRIVRFLPAFDRRHPDPSKNYGIHGVEMVMYVAGPEGATQFKLFTNWHLPEVQIETEARACSRGTDYLNPGKDKCMCIVLARPMAADLGYHRKTPAYADQRPIGDGACEWTSGDCYYDGSGLNAERIFETLVREGDEAVWQALEEYYEEAVAT